jgi:hypothetical protein
MQDSPTLAAHPTVADLADAIGQDTRVLRRRRAELVAGLLELAAFLGHPQEKMSASPGHLTAGIDDLLSQADLNTASKLRALRRIALAASERTGLIAVPGRFRQPLPRVWEKILAKVKYGHHSLL